MDERIRRHPGRAVAEALLKSASLPTSDLTDAHMAHFFFCGSPSAPTGLVGVELFGETALLRSLVVSDSQRSQGLGRALLAHVERYARTNGARALYLLTTTAEGFFSRNGYSATARETAPDAIRRSQEFSALCPASSAFMVKPL